MKKQNPVVFLDMDGVICTRKAAGWSKAGRPLVRRLVKTMIRLPVRAIDMGAVARLDDICTRCAAEVVVSSMWRIDRDVPALLRMMGFRGAIHLDWRTDADGPTRGDEVTRWLDAHDYPAYVVLDDKPEELNAHSGRLVLTDNWSGLSQEDSIRAIDILGGSTADLPMGGMPQAIQPELAPAGACG